MPGLVRGGAGDSARGDANQPAGEREYVFIINEEGDDGPPPTPGSRGAGKTGKGKDENKGMGKDLTPTGMGRHRRSTPRVGDYRARRSRAEAREAQRQRQTASGCNGRLRLGLEAEPTMMGAQCAIAHHG